MSLKGSCENKILRVEQILEELKLPEIQVFKPRR